MTSRTASTRALSVPVGTTSIAGYGASASAFVLALVAFLSGDRTEDTVRGVVAGVVGGAVLVVTQLGRYWQARELARGQADAIAKGHSA